MADEKSKYLIPRYPDKDGDRSSPTFHDWQAREMIAEARRTPKRSARRVSRRK